MFNFAGLRLKGSTKEFLDLASEFIQMNAYTCQDCRHTHTHTHAHASILIYIYIFISQSTELCRAKHVNIYTYNICILCIHIFKLY